MGECIEGEQQMDIGKITSDGNLKGCTKVVTKQGKKTGNKKDDMRKVYVAPESARSVSISFDKTIQKKQCLSEEITTKIMRTK